MSEQQEKGMSIFLDVFRRADKNDDGALSWEEFNSFFSDGVLGEVELKNLFTEIDSHSTNNLDTGELCAYFSKHLGPFKGIFSALEDLNNFTSDALLKSSQEYPAMGQVDKFITRFILRESLGQFSALQGPLEAASDALENQAVTESSIGDAEREKGIEPGAAAAAPSRQISHEVDAAEVAEPGSVIPGRYSRRARRQLSSQTSWTEGSTGGLTQQVDRLKSMIDQLENKVNFDNMTDEDTVDSSEDNMIVIVNRRLRVDRDQDKAFRGALKSYVESAGQADGCLHVHVRSYAATSNFALYEIWETEDEWKSFANSSKGKGFRRECIDFLDVPEQTNSMTIPANWWKRE